MADPLEGEVPRVGDNIARQRLSHLRRRWGTEGPSGSWDKAEILVVRNVGYDEIWHRVVGDNGKDPMFELLERRGLPT